MYCKPFNTEKLHKNVINLSLKTLLKEIELVLLNDEFY